MTASPQPKGWQQQADEWAREAVAAGEPTAWFDRLYEAGRSGEVTMPWDHDDPHPVLAAWSSGRAAPAAGATAVVIGCGLGADAEHLARLGYATTAFDLSEAAVAEARARHVSSSVDYVVADLLDPPAGWQHGFDLVVEIYTVQAVPRSMRTAMTRAVTELIAPDGTLLAVQAVLAEGDDPDEGPPWPLTRQEVEAFADADGLHLQGLSEGEHPARPGVRLWEAEVRRTA
ncbi:class I SAM-dependent methyltransferase [Luteipulveratus halotolerans]|uniref:Methyltransferase domain-containing protein n=1 Tax=Luteipulveratus halotolerans TaxID=1631356 RepID=A0A0L6CH93_9MICO|nr:class I SAM-dependent methyltransferase [Luteipulveratus halotolerans]KNX36935.1 hypothetical protein VV01_06865 [Luteipulveratus halotolerans]